MDTYCTRCGEPWDIDSVRDAHHEPGEWLLRGKWCVLKCPCCIRKPDNEIKPLPNANLAAIASDVLGDDIDAIAATLDDFNYLTKDE